MQFSVDNELLNDELTALIKNVSSSNRRKIAKEIAFRARANRSDQIKKNIDPSGTSFEARKPQKRKGAKRGRMFKKLGARRSMLARYNASEAMIGFRGKNLGIAKVHQEGGLGTVNQQGLKVRYPERRLMGIGRVEREIVRDAIITALANGTHLKG